MLSSPRTRRRKGGDDPHFRFNFSHVFLSLNHHLPRAVFAGTGITTYVALWSIRYRRGDHDLRTADVSDSRFMVVSPVSDSPMNNVVESPFRAYYRLLVKCHLVTDGLATIRQLQLLRFAD